MTLTTLLLIAGDISSHNIDTLGQSEKRFRYYVEPTGHALDRRDATQAKNRGWAWLEFGSAGGGDDEYFTLLLFAESRRADGALKVQWCTAHGPARVRHGLALARAGVVAEPGQLRDVPGFTVHRSGTAYREDIARTLYGSSVAWLDQVIRILRVVRTPQIGHRLDLRFLTGAFRGPCRRSPTMRSASSPTAGSNCSACATSVTPPTRHSPPSPSSPGSGGGRGLTR